MLRPDLVTLLTLTVLTTGCTMGPVFKRPEPPVPASFTQISGAEKVDAVRSSWWRKLNDTKLNDLIQQATNENRDLAGARARLQEARALWKEARLDFVPIVTAGASYENNKSGITTQGPQNGPRNFELYRTGFDTGWELDFFGRGRSAIRAAKATTAAAESLLQNVLVTLHAELTINYLELRGAQTQLAVAQENAANQQEAMRIAEAALKGGRGTQLDVARASSLWNATRAQIPSYEESIARTIHRISVLCGQNPSQLRSSLSRSSRQPAPPARVAVTKPADVLRQRPDIQVAEKVLEAETARIGIEAADLFPRVTFGGRVNLEGATLSSLSQSGATGYSFGPAISWAFLDLARVRQRIEAASRRSESALATYEQTVLLALEEAENALVAFDRERQRLQLLAASESSAREAATLARQRYQDGVADFLTVLDAERVALNAQNDVVLSRTRAAIAWVQIHKALGGG
jgi:outer membrane protein, multidrug efflux system